MSLLLRRGGLAKKRPIRLIRIQVPYITFKFYYIFVQKYITYVNILKYFCRADVLTICLIYFNLFP